MLLKNKLKHWTIEFIKLMLMALVITSAIDFWRSKDLTAHKMPLLSAYTINGKFIDVNKMSKDKPVLLYFWGTWCPVCNTVSPSVNWLSKKYQVISVAMRSGSQAQLEEFMANKNYNFPIINDPKGQISQEWGVKVTPFIIIVKNDEVVFVTTGITTPIGLWLRLFFA